MPGYYCRAGSTSSNASACPAGTYNGLARQESKAACLECPVGSYCSRGTETPTRCIDEKAAGSEGLAASRTTRGLGAMSSL